MGADVSVDQHGDPATPGKPPDTPEFGALGHVTSRIRTLVEVMPMNRVGDKPRGPLNFEVEVTDLSNGWGVEVYLLDVTHPLLLGRLHVLRHDFAGTRVELASHLIVETVKRVAELGPIAYHITTLRRTFEEMRLLIGIKWWDGTRPGSRWA